jgi:hypothetical protein
MIRNNDSRARDDEDSSNVCMIKLMSIVKKIAVICSSNGDKGKDRFGNRG